MEREIDVLVGQVLKSVTQHGDESINFETLDGKEYRMFHNQDCCESVTIDDIVGDLDDLIGTPILIARCDTNSDNPKDEEWNESFTWTFYNIATIKGTVTIRWYGESNGYYSEGVDFEELD